MFIFYIVITRIYINWKSWSFFSQSAGTFFIYFETLLVQMIFFDSTFSSISISIKRVLVSSMLFSKFFLSFLTIIKENTSCVEGESLETFVKVFFTLLKRLTLSAISYYFRYGQLSRQAFFGKNI